MNGTVTYRRTSDVESVRELIVGIHVEVRGEFGLMGDPFYAPERFSDRLTTYASRPGWEAVVGYAGDEPIGYVFAVPLGADTGWWKSEKEPLPAEYTAEDGGRTLALNEILVRQQWRGAHGKGAAHALHEELLRERREKRVTLLVNPLRSDGRLKAVYEAWGYKQVGSQQPFADSPVFASMMRDPLR
ncbi:N-acetyltransferase [Streptomyces triticiradicis]|uniref:N-acetyltransferase n=1 Tax=Streptomyces triticiradicis TaxID=2651189 RepID=A0A7J5DM32_9ACTN|nr:N-acetyltransferase [Streptomyces triticiradicis]KAB1989786.1 N-acetyltransferase [Streptomyces triticiradicis]